MAASPIIDISSSPAGTQARVPPSSHRLATLSASDALQNLDDNSISSLKTGLPSLDATLGGATAVDRAGGLERGKVTEIWGPSGAGTTALALQVAATASREGHGSVWVDCATPLSRGRFEALVSQSLQQASGPTKHMRQLSAPTLSHLLTFVLNPQPHIFADGTALLAIDNLNTLIDLDYPRAQAIGSSRTEAQKWQAGRRYAVLGALVTGLNKLAAMYNLAVIVTTGCAMRTRPDSGLGGALAPGVGGAEWDAGIWNRLVVFRDFTGRFTGIQKRASRSLISREELGETGQLVVFDVSQRDGTLQERQTSKLLTDGTSLVKLKSSPTKARKRYIDEVADSEDEDEYGWDAGDEDVFANGTVTAGEQGSVQAIEPNTSLA